jgi:hypothetical protein
MPLLKSPPPPKGESLYGHMTLDPHGIRTHATILFICFAHIYSPSRVGDEAHHRHARDCINATHLVPVDCIDADAASATYLVGGGRGKPPLTIRVQIGRPAADCLSLRMANGTWVAIDLTWIHCVAANPA